MYNISKETLTQQVNEIEELKVSLQDQIKENLRLEVKKKEEHEQAIRRFDN
jgi:predicted transcriptional regulator|tara:strand:- start:227 stop:379 length:153 start_codon:yes stop_codon:yes gene_type:complete